MSRTVSARISKEIHEKLRERCNNAGCTINDWLEAAIDYLLTGSSDFDFGEEESEIIDEFKKDESNPKKPLDNHEGKKPCLHFHWEDAKLVQGETTWD